MRQAPALVRKGHALAWAAALALAGGALTCRGDAPVEAGAILLSIVLERPGTGGALPDHLRVNVYDDTGVLFRDERAPANGDLAPGPSGELGTILVALGVTRGPVRVHVRGLRSGQLAVEGVLAIAPGDLPRGR